jgi:hypothetical protein
VSRPLRHLAVLSLILLALVLRVLCLPSQPVDADEAMHLHPRPAAEALTFDLMFNPPLYRAATATLCKIDRSVTAARLLPVAAGTLSVLLLYLLGARTVGMGPALLAAFLLAIHPWHIRHSQTLRCFALLTFLVLLSELLARGRSRAEAHGPDATPVSLPPPGDTLPAHTADSGRATTDHWSVPSFRSRRCGLLLLPLVLGLGMLTHYLAFFHAAAQAARSFLAGRKKTALAIAVTSALVAASLLPFLLAGTERKVTDGGVPYQAGLPFLWSLARASFAPGGLSLFAALLLAVLGTTCRAARPFLLPAGIWIGTTLLAGTAIPIEVRYCLPALPFLLLLLAAGTWTLWQKRRLAAAVVTLLAVAGVLWPLPDYYRAPRDPAPALAIHPDLSHVEADMEPLLPELRRAASRAVPIFAAVRGPFHYRLAAEIHDGRYPDDAVLVEQDDCSILTAGSLRVVTAEPRHIPTGVPGGPCLLLREPSFPCTPVATCSPAGSSLGMELFSCLAVACAAFPCKAEGPP